MLETDALKEKLEMEIHRFARPPEELSSGDPYFEQLQTMLAIREELENIPLCDIQRDMLLAMENVLESAWLFRNTPVPDRCMNPNNISEVVYYFLQDKGAEYRGDLLYERAKAEFDARMEELAALPPKEILDHAYEKIIKEDFLCHLVFQNRLYCILLYSDAKIKAMRTRNKANRQIVYLYTSDFLSPRSLATFLTASILESPSAIYRFICSSTERELSGFSSALPPSTTMTYSPRGSSSFIPSESFILSTFS